MGLYDVFSRFYDASVERLYRLQRQLSAEALNLQSGCTVLDLPCGTGQSFSYLFDRVGKEGQVLGVDLSPGMLREARRRIEGQGWSANVHLLHAAAAKVSLDALSRAAGRTVRFDRLHIFLGLSVFPDFRETFAHLWELLEPGGRCVVVDVHSERPGIQGRMVNLIARADITRKFWEPLEEVARDYERRELPSERAHGGQIYLATGAKR